MAEGFQERENVATMLVSRELLLQCLNLLPSKITVVKIDSVEHDEDTVKVAMRSPFFGDAGWQNDFEQYRMIVEEFPLGRTVRLEKI